MKTIRAIFTAVFVCGWGWDLQAQDINGIVAVVHDKVVTRQEVREMTTPIADTLRRQYAGKPDLFNQKVSQAYNDNLEQLVERLLILHEFETAGYNLPESIVEEAVQARIRERYGDRARFTKSLQAEGIRYEKFRQQVRAQYIERAMRSRNISSEVMISPHKIEAYYLAHTNDYQLEDQVKLRMIVLNKSPGTDGEQTLARAREILAKIKEGAKFSEMASEVASLNGNATQGRDPGDRGWVERSVLRKELADVAFSLPVGEPSDVIDTPEACYLMLVEEKKTAHTKPLADVRAEIEKILATQESARLQKQWIDRLREKTYVRYF